MEIGPKGKQTAWDPNGPGAEWARANWARAQTGQDPDGPGPNGPEAWSPETSSHNYSERELKRRPPSNTLVTDSTSIGFKCLQVIDRYLELAITRCISSTKLPTYPATVILQTIVCPHMFLDHLLGCEPPKK